MAEIERALSASGYVVVSWRALRTAAGGDSSRSPIDAARQMGASVLLQVNALERVEVEASNDSRWSRAYFETNESGVAGPLLPLPGPDRRALRELLSVEETAMLAAGRPGISLDVNAILVSSGQTFWFYRWTKASDAQAASRVRLFAEQIAPGTWRSLAIPSMSEGDEPLRSSESDAISTSRRDASALSSVLFRESRIVVDDFVRRFVQSFEAARSSQPAPEPPPSTAPVAAPEPPVVPAVAAPVVPVVVAPAVPFEPAPVEASPLPPPETQPHRRRHRTD